MLKELYMKYSDELFRYAARLTGNTSDAEEILQNIFVKLSKKEMKNNITNIRAYLYKCARNETFSYIRRRQRHQAIDPAKFGSLVYHGSDKEEQDKVSVALNSLPN